MVGQNVHTENIWRVFTPVVRGCKCIAWASRDVVLNFFANICLACAFGPSLVSRSRQVRMTSRWLVQAWPFGVHVFVEGLLVQDRWTMTLRTAGWNLPKTTLNPSYLVQRFENRATVRSKDGCFELWRQSLKMTLCCVNWHTGGQSLLLVAPCKMIWMPCLPGPRTWMCLSMLQRLLTFVKSHTSQPFVIAGWRETL